LRVALPPDVIMKSRRAAAPLTVMSGVPFPSVSSWIVSPLVMTSNLLIWRGYPDFPGGTLVEVASFYASAT
jgi:hypothetical protein